MITLQQLGSGGDELDLGAFIAELRAELLALRRGETDRVRATVGDRPAAPDAERLLADAPEGQLDPEELLRNTRLPRSDRTLASLCARDLQSDSAAVRRRAAERLLEGRVDALAPLIATLVGREPEAPVRVVYVKLLARRQEDWSTIALQQALRDSDARVRAASLEALTRRPGIDLTAVLRDPAPAVRRRALPLLRRTDSASVELLSQALYDDEPSVRHVAALTLASHPGPEVLAVLSAAAQSTDPEVRSVAVKALERRGLLDPAVAVPPPVATEPSPAHVAAEPPAVSIAAPVAVVATEEGASSLDEAVVSELGTALRGATVEDLAGLLQRNAEDVSVAVERLLVAGRVVRRGRKLFQP
jgi:HEAT repeat protein